MNDIYVGGSKMSSIYLSVGMIILKATMEILEMLEERCPAKYQCKTVDE